MGVEKYVPCFGWSIAMVGAVVPELKLVNVTPTASVPSIHGTLVKSGELRQTWATGFTFVPVQSPAGGAEPLPSQYAANCCAATAALTARFFSRTLPAIFCCVP